MYEYEGAAGDWPVGNRVWMMGGWWRARSLGVDWWGMGLGDGGGA